MSVSIEEIKQILINSYSEIFGNIDTRYIIMTRFLETSPGVFDYTCELLIPQSKIFESTLSTVQNTLDEISEFNKGKSSNQPTFVETKLQTNLVRNAQAVLGDRLDSLIDVNDNNALVNVKAFGKPRQIVTKKRRTVVNKEKNLPVIHSFAVEGTHDHVYSDVVSEGVTVFRRKDGSRYQHDAGTGAKTELSPPDPTFVDYTYKGLTRHLEDALMTRNDVFDSFETPPSITGATLSEDGVLLSGTVDPAIVNHTTVYAVLTAFPALSDELLVVGAGTALGNLSSDEGTLSIDQADAGSIVYHDAGQVDSSALNVVFVHLVANNDPFYASDTFRLERAGFGEAPYVRIESLETNEADGYIDVVGTVYSSVRDVKNTRVLLLADVSVNETSEELRDFVRFYGVRQQAADRYSVTRFNQRFHKAYTNLFDAAETTFVVADKRFTAVVLAEDGYQTVSVETESVLLRPELRKPLVVSNANNMIYPPTVTYINNYTLRLEPTSLSLTNGRITWALLSNTLDTTQGYVYEFLFTAMVFSRNRGDNLLMFGRSINQHLVYDTTDLNAIVIRFAKLGNNGFYTWTRNPNAWFSANNESLNPSAAEFASSEALPEYWRLSMVTRNGQRDALLQVFRDPERFDLVMYGYLSDVGRIGSHNEFQSPFAQIGFGCSVYDQGTSGFAPDNVTFGDLTEFSTNRGPGIYENPQEEDGLLLSVRETDWSVALGGSPDYDLSLENEGDSVYYGKSCALSADAKVVVIGGFASDIVGGVVVMEYNPAFDGWGKHTADGRFEIGNKHSLIRTTTWDTSGNVGRAGESTDVSGDGKTLIVSGSISNSTTSGYAVIYEYDDATKEWGRFDANGVFTQGGYHDLRRSGTLGKYGRVSRLSLNGKVAVVAGDAQYCAFVWTYDETSATWIMKQDLTLNHSNYGHSAAVSADGRTIVIGRSPSSVYGQMYVWKYDSVADAYVNTHLIHKNPTHGQFGFSVAVSADGRVVIGGGHKGFTSGCAFVYHYNESTDQWGRFDATDGFVNNDPHNLSVTADANCRYGVSCSMSADGRTAIVSGDRGGDCFVWTYKDFQWSLTNRIVNDTYAPGYGVASDVSSDGSVVVVSGTVSSSLGGVLLWNAKDLGGRDLLRIPDKQLVGDMPSLSFRMLHAIAGLEDGLYDTMTYNGTLVPSGNDNLELHQMYAGDYIVGTENGKKYFMNHQDKSFGEFNVGASNFTIAFVLSAKGYEYNSTSRLTYGISPGNADRLNIHLSSTLFGYFPLQYPIRDVVNPDSFMTSDYFMYVVSYNKDLDGGTLTVVLRNRSPADAQIHRFVDVNGATTYNPSNTIDRIFTLWNQTRLPFRVFDMMTFPGEYVGGNDSPLLNQLEYYVRNEYGIVAP